MIESRISSSSPSGPITISRIVGTRAANRLQNLHFARERVQVHNQIFQPGVGHQLFRVARSPVTEEPRPHCYCLRRCWPALPAGSVLRQHSYANRVGVENWTSPCVSRFLDREQHSSGLPRFNVTLHRADTYFTPRTSPTGSLPSGLRAWEAQFPAASGICPCDRHS